MVKYFDRCDGYIFHDSDFWSRYKESYQKYLKINYSLELNRSFQMCFTAENQYHFEIFLLLIQ